MELIINIFKIAGIRQRVTELNTSFSIRCLVLGHFNCQVLNFGRSQSRSKVVFVICGTEPLGDLDCTQLVGTLQALPPWAVAMACCKSVSASSHCLRLGSH